MVVVFLFDGRCSPGDLNQNRERAPDKQQQSKPRGERESSPPPLHGDKRSTLLIIGNYWGGGGGHLSQLKRVGDFRDLLKKCKNQKHFMRLWIAV